MKKALAILLVTVLCLSLCACGKEYNQAMDLLELVEDHRYDEAHELLNEMAGEGATKWVPEYYVSDPWVDNDPCGDIGSGSDFWNGDDSCKEGVNQPSCEPESSTEPEPEEPKEIPVEGIMLSSTELTLPYEGAAELKAYAYPENTTEYVGIIHVYSSDPRIVQVNPASGSIQAVGVGTTTITATWKDYEATCTVTVENPKISTAEELLAIEFFDHNVTYELVADIDMKGIAEPEHKANVQGILEGNGHKIYNLGYGPLFNEVGGEVRNLIIECEVDQVKTEENAYIDFATIAYTNNGLIQHCVSKGNVRLAVDDLRAAGIVLISDTGKVYQCANEINFTFPKITVVNRLGAERAGFGGEAAGVVIRGNANQCYNVGNFATEAYIICGGVVYEAGTVVDCYNLGEMTNAAYGGGIASQCGTIETSINYSSADSAITGGHHYGYIIDCYYLKSKAADGAFAFSYGESENSHCTRIHGLSDAEAKKQESYGALDFENVWTMGPDGYPILKWQTEQ